MDTLLVQAISYQMDLNVPMTVVPGAGASLVVVQHGDQPLLGSGKIKLMVSMLLSMEYMLIVLLFIEYMLIMIFFWSTWGLFFCSLSKC